MQGYIPVIERIYIMENKQLPNNASLLETAIFYEENEKLDLAEEYYKKAYEDDESFAAIYLANLYQKQGKLDLAEEWYRKESDDHDSCAGDGNNALSRFLIDQGREDEAWEYLERVLFVDHSDTAPYEGAMLLACKLLGQGKCWDKITEYTFSVVYTFLDYPYSTDNIYFMEENLRKCVKSNTPNASQIVGILAQLYICGTYTVLSYDGCETGNTIKAPFLIDQEKGTAILKEMEDTDLKNLVVFFEKSNEDFTSLEAFIDLFGYVYDILASRTSMMPDFFEVADMFLEFLGDEEISDENMVKLCTKIADCQFWWDVICSESYSSDLCEKLSDRRITEIFKTLAPLRNEDVSYFLGMHYNSIGEYRKAIDAWSKHIEKDGTNSDYAAAEISKYYQEGRPGIPQCFKSAVYWAAKTVTLSEDGSALELGLVGSTPEETEEMWKELFHRITTDPTPEIVEYFWAFIEDFEDYYTSEEYTAVLTALVEYGDERAEEELQD